MATPLVPASATSFQYRMPAGFPGTLSRQAGSGTYEPAVIDAANPPLFYGQAVVQDANGVRPPTTTDTVINGLLIRPYPAQGGFPASPTVDPIGTSNVPTSGVCTIMRRGYMSVTLSGSAAAAKDAQAYVWIGATGGAHVNGGIEAAPTYTFTETANGAGAGGANTGNGTFTTGPAAGAAFIPGQYKITFLTATTYTVVDPYGAMLPNGTSLAYADAQISFTITAGTTAFVAGDGFLINTTASTLPLVRSYFTGPADSNGITEIAYNIN